MASRATKRRADRAEVVLDTGAQAFLHALQDAGYLVGSLDDEVLDRLAHEAQGLARAEDVRRIAAQVLFERQFDADLIQLLDEEWKAVFS
jgi:hypothetical protein